MENFIIIGIVLLIVAAVTVYLVRANKSGEKCIGCPYCKTCSGGCNEKEKK